jgi:hypothetical protein
MRILIHDKGQIVLTEQDNFQQLSITFYDSAQPSDAVLPGLIQDDEDHFWIDRDFIAKLAERADKFEWQRNFEGMVNYARRSGWVDDAGRIRVHADRLAKR